MKKLKAEVENTISCLLYVAYSQTDNQENERYCKISLQGHIICLPNTETLLFESHFFL